MEFNAKERKYEPTRYDRALIGQHQAVYEHDAYQMSRLARRCIDAIELNGGDPLSTPATRLADANIGLICFHSGPKPLLAEFRRSSEFQL